MSKAIKFKKLDPDALIPTRETPGSTGLDLATTGEYTEGKDVVYWKTGLAVQPPKGYYLEIHPRSSLHKKGWMLVNSTGIIDSDYRGELIIALVPIKVKANLDVHVEIEEGDCNGYGEVSGHCGRCWKDILISPKTRIAQLILRKNELVGVEIDTVEELSETERGEGGFGSTG